MLSDFFYQFDTTKDLWKKDTLIEELPPSDWPIKMSEGLFLD